MSNRQRARRDGEPTADDLQRARDNCEDHTESFKQPGSCLHCSAPMDLPRSDDGVDDLSKTLPPSDQGGAGETSSAEVVAERQADAAADSVPPGIGGSEDGRNLSRYEYIQQKFDRLIAIKAEQKSLREESNEIVQDLEKESGVNRGALSEIRKLFGLEAAAIQARETSRRELFELIIQPKLDEATEGEGEE